MSAHISQWNYMASNRLKRMPKANIRLASTREETDKLEASARGESAGSIKKKKRKPPSLLEDTPSKKKTHIISSQVLDVPIHLRKSPPETDIGVSVNPVSITAAVILATLPTITTATSTVSQGPLPTITTADSATTAERQASLPATVVSFKYLFHPCKFNLIIHISFFIIHFTHISFFYHKP